MLKELNDGECCVCEVTDTLQAGQSRLSFHLKVLKKARLIRDRRDGRWMYYRVNAEGAQ
ncbi:MAG: ArsR/SmtB family transcription factor [Nitrospira sp.]